MQLRRAGLDDFVILEQADGLGGTWRDNSYPGAACDVPAVLYSFSFEPNPEWSHRYARQPEILAYLERCADKYDLRRKIRFGAEVRHARFDAVTGQWLVEVADGSRVRARILISGTGQLSRPFIPDIPGRAAFHGCSFHSARWRHDHAFEGKRVGVIGNGASAVQIVPRIAAATAELYVFQRSANWIIPRRDRRYTPLEKWLRRHLPLLPEAERRWTWLRLEAHWPAFSRPGGVLGRLAERASLRHMRAQVADPALYPALTPDYPEGCKRVLLSDDYYPALNRPNVRLVTAPIEGITPGGIRTRDGREHGLDTIVFATGFRSTELLAPMTIQGRDGRDLADAWRDGAEAYLGVTVPGFPNFFLLYGPNTNLGHNSIIFMIERQVEYVLRCVRALRERRLRYLELRPEAMDRWRREARAGLARTVWAADCRSWYKTADGRITNNWPYTTAAYWRRMRRLRLGDYRLVPATTAGGTLAGP